MAHFGAHVVKFRPVALAVMLVVGACAQSIDGVDRNVSAATTASVSRAPSDEAPPTENGVYIAAGICFGEGGCPWVHWRAHEPVEVHERIDAASPVIATLAPGEWVEPVEGQLRLVPKRGVVRTAHQGLEAGDVIYRLDPQGEGDFVIWRRGEFLFWRWPDSPEEESFIDWDPPAPSPAGTTLGWWVRLRLASGQSGWVQDPQFECMGPLAGDENCRE